MKTSTVKLLKEAQKLASNPNGSTPAQKAELVKQIEEAISDEGDNNPWWVVLLKVLAYAIGLILAGMGTTTALCTLGLTVFS